MAVEDDIAAFVRETTYDDIPPETIAFTKHLLLKTIAGTVVGSRTPSGEAVLDYVTQNTETQEARVPGAGLETSVENAALANGYFSHAAELEDDQFPVATSDITVIPVVLALADAHNLSGKDVIEITTIGMEVMNRFGSFPVTHLGYSDLPFYGVIGAQVAAAKAYDFTEKQIKDMLGLGIAQASGWLVNFGTAAHYWESAVPCRNAITTAELTAAGADGNPDIKEWLETLLDREIDTAEITNGLGDTWAIHESCIKKYPVCFLTHRQVDAFRALRDEHDLRPETVERIHTELGPVDEVVDRPNPTTIDDARFSIQHVLATLLIKGDISYSDLIPERLDDPAIVTERNKVQVTHRDDWPAEFNSGAPTVTVTLNDGTEVSRQRKALLGGPEEPLTTDEMRALYHKILATYYDKPVLTDDQIDNTAETILDLDQYDSLDSLFETLTYDTTAF